MPIAWKIGNDYYIFAPDHNLTIAKCVVDGVPRYVLCRGTIGNPKTEVLGSFGTNKEAREFSEGMV